MFKIFFFWPETIEQSFLNFLIKDALQSRQVEVKLEAKNFQLGIVLSLKMVFKKKFFQKLLIQIFGVKKTLKMQHSVIYRDFSV